MPKSDLTSAMERFVHAPDLRWIKSSSFGDNPAMAVRSASRGCLPSRAALEKAESVIFTSCVLIVTPVDVTIF